MWLANQLATMFQIMIKKALVGRESMLSSREPSSKDVRRHSLANASACDFQIRY
jgi:hypothetical protein